MYKALYSFDSDNPNALSFRESDNFNVIEDSDPHWLLVENGAGSVGYVPGNYLAKNLGMSHTDTLHSLDKSIAILTKNKTDASNLQKLKLHRNKIVEEQKQKRGSVSSHGKRTAPAPPPCSPNHEPKANLPRRQSSKRTAPLPPPSPRSTNGQQSPELSSTESRPRSSQSCSSDFTEVPCGLGGELVEILRKETNMSHSMSQTAVKLVLTHLAERVPSLSPVMVDVVNDMYQSKQKSDDAFVEGHDTERLSEILSGLAECKEDSQQRSWFLHEDEAKISSYLEELISIAGNADPDVSRRMIAREKYQAIHDLVLYYQMETRVTLRLLLLQAFGLLCSLHPLIISELLSSVLPLELARDMQTDFNDKRKLMFSGLLLSMIFCMGEAIPIQYYDHLNESFISFLVDGIERPVADGDGADQIPDTFLRLILAFNLHFELPEDNIIMRVLASRGTAKTFTEMLMLLVNRQDDPVRMFEHEPRPPNSLLKFLSDLYSNQKTANLLYRNDAMVLIDIVLRQLTDLSAGDGMRTEYLSLLHLILANSDYVIHKYRQTEIAHCLTSIANEEGLESQMDKHIVQRIWKDFKGLFCNNL